VKLYIRPALVKDSSTLRPFLFTAMRNACINMIKAEKKHSGLEKVEEFEVNYSISENSIEDKEEEIRIKNLVKNILDQLTVRQREIIYLRFLHQMEYEEISKVMDMSQQAARNLTHRAMDKIRKENSDLNTMLFFLIIFCLCK
jgi:RNA polymerase sigma factor (sigma-70 family)